MTSFESVKYHEELIQKWNDPQDIAQRCAVLIRDIHQMYGRFAFLVYTFHQNTKPKCRHPKKMQDVCAGQRYCMQCNSDLPSKKRR